MFRFVEFRLPWNVLRTRVINSIWGHMPCQHSRDNYPIWHTLRKNVLCIVVISYRFIQTLNMIANNYYNADYSYYFAKINLTLISTASCSSWREPHNIRQWICQRFDELMQLSQTNSVRSDVDTSNFVFETIQNAVVTMHFKYAHSFRIDGWLPSNLTKQKWQNAIYIPDATNTFYYAYAFAPHFTRSNRTLLPNASVCTAANESTHIKIEYMNICCVSGHFYTKHQTHQLIKYISSSV